MAAIKVTDITQGSGDIRTAYNTRDGAGESYSSQDANGGGFTLRPRWFVMNDSSYGIPTGCDGANTDRTGCQFALCHETTQVLEFTTNLSRQGCVSMATPILGAGVSGGTSKGWGIDEPATAFAAHTPQDTHLLGLTSSNFILA
jgi:hypothetical protein